MADDFQVEGEPALEAKPHKKSSSFVGDVSKLVLGTTLSQVLTVLVTPVLARLYDPASFGVSGVYISMATIANVIGCLRYELTIVLPEDDGDAANALAVSLFFSAVLGLATFGLVFALGGWISNLLNVPEMAPFLWLLPFSVFFGSAFNALNYWNTRTKKFMRLSIARIINSAAVITIQLVLGFMMPKNSTGLIWGSMASMVISATVLGAQIFRDDGRFFLAQVRWKRMVYIIVRYKKFPLYSTWAALMNSVSWQLPSFLLTYFFSAEVAGYYAVGNRVLRLPLNLLGSSIGQVFFQRSAEAKAEGKLAHLVEITFKQLVIFGLFPMLTLTFIGADFFRLVFGPAYAESGVYTQILSIWTFVLFLSSPMSMLFATLEKQEFSLTINAMILVTRLLSLAAGGLLNNARLAIVFFAITGLLVYGYLNVSIMRASGVKYSSVIRITWNNFLYFVPLMLILGLMLILHVNSWLLIGVAVLYNGVYYLYAFTQEPQLYNMVKKRLPFLARLPIGLNK